jgi:hypothetical protein
MRALMILILTVSTSCTNTEKALVVNKPVFKKIPFDLSTHFLDTIALKIKPVKDYQYWAYISFKQDMSGKERTVVISQGGDTLLRKNVNARQKTFGFFQGGHPSFRCNYIVALDNRKEKVIDTEQGFRKFLGTVDNLEEAVLLAISYGYWLDLDVRGSAFRIHNGNYEMHLLKYSSHPVQKESVKVTINKNGTITTKSLGVYCKGWLECR